ncbi:PqiC family protein [Pseudoalteromonas aurantia]|uniref:ABC-type transport auxiliary lipoprotein component domain-containing protein n=1 Tax=Pseudoalteromonas aurantia TaxID=43654 RepID=A0A5S3VCB6_9GAMM|nr:ABC-type transport auxiliary lipoprotein family protein [Pseudoalteromonas aurantia]TMO69690.1 hypothetical protein CWC19_04360 [Pseudoalteromonas aurantia]TMO75722.1 hypothetical protein CWC20_07100 [Pseudoalteromonas aurantia]
MKGLIPAFFSVLFVVGCTGNSNNGIEYYQFNTSTTVSNSLAPDNTVLLKPIKIIGLSDQQAIAQIHSNHSVSIANFNYWSEHPKHMLYKSAQHLLSQALNKWQVIDARVGALQFPYFEVEIHVSDFAGHEKHGGIISGNWYIFYYRNDQKRLLKTQHFVASQPLQADGYPALVNALENSWIQVNMELKAELEKVRAAL